MYVCRWGAVLRLAPLVIAAAARRSFRTRRSEPIPWHPPPPRGSPHPSSSPARLPLAFALYSSWYVSYTSCAAPPLRARPPHAGPPTHPISSSFPPLSLGRFFSHFTPPSPLRLLIKCSSSHVVLMKHQLALTASLREQKRARREGGVGGTSAREVWRVDVVGLEGNSDGVMAVERGACTC